MATQLVQTSDMASSIPTHLCTRTKSKVNQHAFTMMANLFSDRWEQNNNYCQELLKPSNKYYHLLLDITDTTVFDFLTGIMRVR